MKKKLSLLLASMLVMTLVPVSSFAAKTTTSNSFSADYDSAVVKTYVVEFDTQLDTIAANEEIRFDLGNAKFTTATTVGAVDSTTNTPVTGASITVAGSVGVVKFANPVKGVVTVGLSINTKDSDEGDVTLDIRHDLFEKMGMVIGTVKATSSKSMSLTVKDNTKTVSMAGGELSQFEIKNYDKTTSAKDIEIKLEGSDAELASAIVNGQSKDAINGVVTMTAAEVQTQSYIIVTPVVAADRKIELGSVDVEVTQGDKSVSAKVGEVVDYNITVKVVEDGKKEIPTKVAGKTATVKVTISGTDGSITSGRAYDIELDGATVAYTQAAGTTVGSLSATPVSGVTINTMKLAHSTDAAAGTTDEFTVTANSTSKMEFTMDIKVDADAKDGVATMTIASRDLDEDITVDIANVETAFTVDTVVTDIVRGEALGTADIVITENAAGQLTVGQYVTIKLNGKTLFNEKPSIEGTNGIKFGDVEWVKVDGDTVGITAKVTTKSKNEPAVITISGAAVDMLSNGINGRTYTASLFVGTTKGAGTEYAEFDYTKCVAEYDKTTASTLVFTLGSANYTINGVVSTLEAPVFTKDGRTMLPIGPLALGLGLDVNYNADTQTATFRDGTTGQVVSVKENADVLYNNGIEYKMHTAAVTVNGRIFVPVASITDAFGVAIAWDEATQTVKVN